MKQVLSVLLAFCIALVVTERARYDNYHVYKVTAAEDGHLKVLQELEGTSDSVLFIDGPYALSKAMEVVVAPHKVPHFINILQKTGVPYDLVEKDAQKRLDFETTGSSRSTAYSWTSYHTLNETYDWLRSLAKNFPNQVSLVVGGHSYERRDILGIKISYKNGNPGVFVEGGIHAREWISSATVTYLANQLLTSTSPEIRDIAENNDWYIFPHTNPDGYEYTWSHDRFWRKTRKPYGYCYGADPNRNWDSAWNTVGSSDYPCSETYAGPSPGSEIEVASLSKYIKSLKGKINLYLSFHSFSQYLLYPFGYTSQLPPNAADLESIFNVTVEAISKRYGTKYTGGNTHDAIYPASGSSIDWAYYSINARLSFCYELRPATALDVLGFALPASQIIPTGAETLDSLVALIDKARELKYF